MKQALHAKLSLYVVATVWAGAMPAQAQANSGGIYACTDANGRRITADRPIASCVDREQRVLGNTGVELRRVGPTLTDQERSAQEAKRRQDQAEQQRLREERSRARHAGALPSQGVHDAARAEAIAQVNDVIGVAQQRLVDLRNAAASSIPSWSSIRTIRRRLPPICAASSTTTRNPRPSSSASSSSRKRKSSASTSASMPSCSSCASYGQSCRLPRRARTDGCAFSLRGRLCAWP
jgi:hypothetical protein